jgi:drug/metabolite transporter (DMT)-like permease
MFWLLLIIIVAVGFSLNMFMDNYVADVMFKKTCPEAVKVLGVFVYLATALLVLIFAPPTIVPIGTIIFLVLAGLIDGLSAIPYFRSLRFEDTTGVMILTQMSPIVALIFGYFFLGDRIAPLQILAFLLILSATMFITLGSGKRKTKIEIKAALLILVAIFGWVISDVFFIAKGEQINFQTAFFWLIIGKLLSDTILTLIFKSWRKKIKRVLKEFKGKLIAVFITNEITYLGSEALWRFAMLLAPIALAHVTADVLQLLVTFFLGIVLSIIWPKFGRETLKPKIVKIHLIASLLAAAGIVLLQI